MLKINTLISPKIFNSNIKKNNSASLGWVRPDNTITFQTPTAAHTYAKNRVIQALKAQIPYEKGVLVKSNRILGEINGNFNSIDISKSKLINKTNNADFVHGHPDLYPDGAMPLSLGDFLTMSGHQMRSIIAYNKRGEYSILSTKPKSNFWNLMPSGIKNFFDLTVRVGASSTALEKYTKMWSDFFPAELREKVRLMIHANINNELLSGKKVIERGRNLQKNANLVNQITLLEHEFIQSGTAARSIHNFWKDNADKFNVRYTTNFSGLK